MLAWLIRRRYVAFANNEIMTDMIREGQGEDKSMVPITSSAAIVNGKTALSFLFILLVTARPTVADSRTKQGVCPGLKHTLCGNQSWLFTVPCRAD